MPMWWPSSGASILFSEKSTGSMGRKLKYPLTEDDKVRLKQKSQEFADRRSAILPGLHLAYDRHGFVNFEMYSQIADLLDIPVVFVMEAATFYTFFPKKPAGKFHIKVCDNLPCALRGACAMVKYLKEKHGIVPGETTKDGLFSLVTEECLAGCGGAPMLQLNDMYHENMTPDSLDRLIAKCKSEAGVQEPADSHA